MVFLPHHGTRRGEAGRVCSLGRVGPMTRVGRIFTRYPLACVVVVVWGLWLPFISVHGQWHHFLDKYPMALTMVLGSFLAGSTCIGGGAVAYPVMAWWLEIDAGTARDFALLIQTVGMGAASVTIFARRTRLCFDAIVYAGLGGVFGVVIGLEAVAPRVAPAIAKVFFASLWLSFSLALHLTVARSGDVARVELQVPAAAKRWLFLVGIAGGLVTAIVGSGLDVLTFTLLVLSLRVAEDISTPTSVVIMAGNAAVGALYRTFVQGETAPLAFEYWYVCVPVVVVGAPLGAWFITGRSRHVIRRMLYTCIAAQFIGAAVLAERTPETIAIGIATFAIGVILFLWMARRDLAVLD